MTALDEIAGERRAYAALLKAARRITKGLDIDELTTKAREWHGSGQQRWFSHANLRDLWEAVERIDRAAQEGREMPHHRVVGRPYGRTIRSDAMAAPDMRVLYDGPWFGPAMFHYATEGCDARSIAAEHGFDLLYVTLEEDQGDDGALAEKYAAGAEAAEVATLWLPRPRAGWKLSGMTDTEDGLVALFLRSTAAQEATGAG